MFRSRNARPLIFALAAAAVTFIPSRTARAQDVFDAKTAGYIRDSYLADLDTLHARFMALANAIPAEKYSWRPTPEVRTVSEAFMHVAGEWYYFTPISLAGKPPADFGSAREKLPALEKQSRRRTPSSPSSISRGRTAARKYWPRMCRSSPGNTSRLASRSIERRWR